jgi:predicted AAA+ superfamily ATPase
MKNTYSRPYLQTLKARLAEPPKFMIVVAGPRQIGKSTLVRQALAEHPSSFEATDQPDGTGFDSFGDLTRITQVAPGAKATETWIMEKWTQARAQARSLPAGRCHVLALDEIQKIPRWSELVKGLWDADRAQEVPLHVVLLGSSPWLMQKGLTESLAGRYEPMHMSHWSYAEMQEAFDFSLDEYIYFGGYPGAASLIRNETRWRQYVRDALIKPNIENDILQMTRVEKPALLKNLFELGCGHYSGQIVALTKLIEQLQDAGNTVTLAHYLDLLSQAGLLTGLQKYAGQELRRRAAPPKFNVHNTALISAQTRYTFEDARNDRSYWGRLVESAVGTHLINNKPENSRLYYWRESPSEVDFVLAYGENLLAIEVKSGGDYAAPKGLKVFSEKFKNVTPLVVGAEGLTIADFLLQPVERWMSQ